MDPREAYELLKQGCCVLVDVREEQELRETGIAEGALWMPMSKIAECHCDWREFKAKLPKNKPIVLYCKSGARSGRIAEFLALEGYVTKNAGGLKDWEAAQLPIKPFP